MSLVEASQGGKRRHSRIGTPVDEIPTFANPFSLPLPLPPIAALSILPFTSYAASTGTDTPAHSTTQASHLLARCQLLAASKKRRLDDLLSPANVVGPSRMMWWNQDPPATTRRLSVSSMEDESKPLLGGETLVRPKAVRGAAFSPYLRELDALAKMREISVIANLEAALVVDNTRTTSSFGDPTPEGTPFGTISVTIGDYWTRNDTVDEPLTTTFCAGCFEWVTQFELALYRITIPLSSIATLSFTATSLTLTLSSPAIYRIKPNFIDPASKWTPSQSVTPVELGVSLNEVHVLTLNDAPSTMRALQDVAHRYPLLEALITRSLSSYQRPALRLSIPTNDLGFSPRSFITPLESPSLTHHSLSTVQDLSTYRFPPASLPPTPPLSPTYPGKISTTSSPIHLNRYIPRAPLLESPPLSLFRSLEIGREGEGEECMAFAGYGAREEEGTESSHGGMDCSWLRY